MGQPFTQPDFTSQNETALKTNYDNAAAVLARLAAMFNPEAQATPDMTVHLDAGAVYDAETQTLTEVAAQNSGTITAPTTDPRIDRAVIDKATGVLTVITGAEAASPTPPAITAGKLPVAQIALVVSQSLIVNADLTDERQLNSLGALGIGAGLQDDGAGNLRVNETHERKTATYTAVAADRGKIIEFDRASAVTLNLTAAATLIEGWFVDVHNSGAGVLTIDPAGAELIDDATTITAVQDVSFRIVCDGAAFWTVGKSSGVLQATRAAIEAETNEDTYLPPDLLKHSPGVAKMWAMFTITGSVSASHNVSSVTDTGTGDWTVNIDTDFSSTDYGISGILQDVVDNNLALLTLDTAAAADVIHVGASLVSDPITKTDPITIRVAGFGDQ
ncbi:MAG: hypothetical protein IH904_00145 [Proteobacteria bacterium]|nr:hypothetical protein [Pseudomonadota bacterium]